VIRLINEDGLFNLTNELSKKHFHKPFKHVVKYNNRLQTTGGRYIPSLKTIEINPKYVREMKREAVIGIIKHELCHYHLHIEGKGFKEKDPDFIKLLKKTGAPKYCEPLPSTMKRHIYVCTKCGLEYKRKRHVNTKRFKCGYCFGKITFVQTIDEANLTIN